MTLKRIALILAAVVATSAVAATSVDAKKGGGGKPGGGCTPAATRLAYASPLTAEGELWAVNPDGSCAVQLTDGTGLARVVWSWTADDHVLVHNQAGAVTLFDVPDSSDPSTVSIVAGPWTPPDAYGGGDVSQHTDATTGVLGAMSQLMVHHYGAAEDNIYVLTLDGAWSQQLTNYVDSHQSGDGTEYRVTNSRWLASSGDHARARIWYSVELIEYANGTPFSFERQHRVLSVDTTGWPYVSTANMTDKPLIGGDALIDGYDLTDLLDFSRDGAKAGGRGPYGDYMLVLDLTYDDVNDEVTIHTESPLMTATDMVGVSHGVSFSPDSGTMLFRGAQDVSRGKKVRRVHGTYLTSTAAVGPSAFVADITDAVWGP